jgi:hypothetical protein
MIHLKSFEHAYAKDTKMITEAANLKSLRKFTLDAYVFHPTPSDFSQFLTLDTLEISCDFTTWGTFPELPKLRKLILLSENDDSPQNPSLFRNLNKCTSLEILVFRNHWTSSALPEFSCLTRLKMLKLPWLNDRILIKLPSSIQHLRAQAHDIMFYFQRQPELSIHLTLKGSIEHPIVYP